MFTADDVNATGWTQPPYSLECGESRLYAIDAVTGEITVREGVKYDSDAHTCRYGRNLTLPDCQEFRIRATSGVGRASTTRNVRVRVNDVFERRASLPLPCVLALTGLFSDHEYHIRMRDGFDGLCPTTTPWVKGGARTAGYDAALRYDPGAAGVGLTASITPAWGLASGGVGQLWRARDARGFGAFGSEFEADRRLVAELGYGLRPGRAPGVVTPHAGLVLGEGGERSLRTGAMAHRARSITLARIDTERTWRRRGGSERRDAPWRVALVGRAAPERARAVVVPEALCHGMLGAGWRATIAPTEKLLCWEVAFMDGKRAFGANGADAIAGRYGYREGVRWMRTTSVDTGDVGGR